MKLISVKISSSLLEGLDSLIRRGLYPSRSEAIRTAIRDLIKEESGRY
ncbi:MAG: ribbon-helix-helix domain-containing protein [Candidatus Kariarchaeaceae archaeon]